MASRAELVQMCDELGIEWYKLSIEEMKSLIRKEVDIKFKSKAIRHSGDVLSYALKRFLVKEYDYKLFDSKGKEIKLK